MTGSVVTVGSGCSGYGGLEMGLAMWLGAGAIGVRWHAEVDPDASRVLKTWWPEVPNLGDFTTGDDFWARAERCDVMAAGIPCQPFSAAGRRKGAEDQRHLWPFWRRGIELHRPPTVVFENVAGLTQGKMRPVFDAIVTDLVELGYDVRWCLLGACAIGAAHHRHRVFLLACRSRSTPHARQVQVQACGRCDAAYLPSPAGRDGTSRGEGSPEYWEQRRAQGGLRAVAGVPLGAALALLRSPTARDGDGKRGRGSIEHMRRRMESGHTINLGDQVQLLPSPRGSDAKNGGPNQGIASGDIALSSVVQPERWGKYAAAIARHETILGRPAPEPTELGPQGGRRLAAAFSEWLMMLPEEHLTSVLDRGPALARAGNGVVPLQVATALELLYRDLRSQ